MDSNEAEQQKVYAALDALGITYQAITHQPVFTAEDAAEPWRDFPGARVKNLFLRNKKGDRHYLVILPIEKQADLRQLVKVIGDDRLSFGSADRLHARLGLAPGSVSPFGLINDTDQSVRVIVDADLRVVERLIFTPTTIGRACRSASRTSSAFWRGVGMRSAG